MKMIGHYAFPSTDQIFKNKAFQRHFTRFLSAHALTTIFLGEDWAKLEARITQLLATEFFQKTDCDFEQNPLQIYLHCILEVTKFCRDARLPKYSELWISKIPQNSLQEAMDLMTKEYQDYSMYANAYYALCALSEDFPLRIDSNTVYSKLNQSLFLIRKA